jgi:hypothetical protein
LQKWKWIKTKILASLISGSTLSPRWTHFTRHFWINM